MPAVGGTRIDGDSRRRDIRRRGSSRRGGRNLRVRKTIKAKIAGLGAAIMAGLRISCGGSLAFRRRGDVRNGVREGCLLAPQQAERKQHVDKGAAG